MGAVIAVSDLADDRLADYRNLTDAAARGQDLFVAEGVLVIRQLVASPYPVRSMLVTPNRVEALAAEIESVAAPTYVVDQSVINAVTGFNIHRGALASGARVPLPPLAAVLAPARRLAVVEGIT
ncbi:MAG: hypothetical protein QOG64_2996, partial [Acidimicrobiaceae bacterium]|nr:hypothetical protein [Acidimicrobiaceae bacterium]